jgi:hypothetical protein
MQTATLTRDQLRHSAPSIFAATPWQGMSDRYRFVGTDGVLDIMADLGFHPVKAMQSRSRIDGKQAFTRHMIRLRHADHLAPTVGEEVPEIVLENSHDGTAAYRLHAGIFRLVCSNGLVIASADFGTISVKHSGGKDFERRIIDATHQIAEGTPEAFRTVADWKQIVLPRPQQLAFAEQAMELKPNAAIKPAFLLTARRQEDATSPDFSRDLWRTFNVIEENMMQGGIAGRNERGRRIRTRPIRSVVADITINRGLWQIAGQIGELN